MKQGQFELQVRINGLPVKEFYHQRNTFVVGEQGEYSLWVCNNSDRKALVVISVDGLSIMTGKTASVRDSGYVIQPYDSMPIPGWRLDNNNVASFEFGSLPESYAAQMGKPDNIGVIGVAFFHEKPPVMDDYLNFGGGMAKGCGPTRGTPRGGTLGGAPKGVGTAFGRQQGHRVTTVPFDRDDHSCGQIMLRYDSVEGLEARGIPVRQKPDRVVDANPFPSDAGCTPPNNWRG